MRNPAGGVTRIPIPEKPARVAVKQIQPILKWYAEQSQYGQFDLEMYGLSCFLQGALDTSEAIKNHPVIFEAVLTDSGKQPKPMAFGELPG